MTGPAALHLVPLSLKDPDAALAALRSVRLVRSDAGIFLACAEVEVARVLLGRAGVRVQPCDAMPAPPPGLLPARASDLAPIRLAGVMDTVTMRTLGTGEAAARLRRHGLLGRSRHDVVRVRAVLHREDLLIAWRRVIWADRALFRAPELRGIRPIFFDREAIAGGDERWTLAGAGMLRGWLRS